MSVSKGSPAGATSISDLGSGSDVLTYRGHAIDELAELASFEEVAFLLSRGRLPTSGELVAYRARLRSLREPPRELVEVLSRLPAGGGLLAVMDALRTGCSALGSMEPEGADESGWLDAADRLIALLPGLMVGWYRRREGGLDRGGDTGASTTAGQILALLEDREPTEERRRCLEVSLICYAELAFNASTYAARICASTGSDLHSCVTTGIATLRGPLHGGASVDVRAFLERFATPKEAGGVAREMIARKERVPGFGHAIFRRDPRSAILHQWARRLGGAEEFLGVAEEVERVVGETKGLRPNVDFYTACCYRSLGLPIELFSPLFVCARVAGWSAHVAEQRGQGRIIHPVAEYQGPARLPYVPLGRR